MKWKNSKDRTGGTVETILETKDIKKTYVFDKNIKQDVLKNINIKIKKGEFVSVMGPSGSGKSTLLYNISGMDRITSGNLIFEGNEISGFSENEFSKLRLEKIGFIFQHINFLKNMNIYDNIAFPAYVAKKQSRKEINKKTEELMKKTGIFELAEKDITEVSGGQLQRAGICRALINNPCILFGDEPTGALNSKYANDVMDIICGINKEGTTVLLVTHDIKVALRSERILFMKDGSITGEYHLGKYGNEYKKNKEKLSEWLMKMDF